MCTCVFVYVDANTKNYVPPQSLGVGPIDTHTSFETSLRTDGMGRSCLDAVFYTVDASITAYLTTIERMTACPDDVALHYKKPMPSFTINTGVEIFPILLFLPVI